MCKTTTVLQHCWRPCLLETLPQLHCAHWTRKLRPQAPKDFPASGFTLHSPLHLYTAVTGCKYRLSYQARAFGTQAGRLWIRAVTHHHDLRVALILDDIHGVLSAVHNGCLHLCLAESLQGSTCILTDTTCVSSFRAAYMLTTHVIPPFIST